jgi:hypothetical protein
MMHFLAGLVLSLFPARYRGETFRADNDELRVVTVYSSLLQMLACLGFYIWRYFAFIRFRVDDLGERVVETATDAALANPELQMGMGIVSLLEYAFQPLSLLLVYFLFEGMIRWVSSAFNNESMGTLPLVSAGWVHDLIEGKIEEKKRGAALADKVETSEAGGENATNIVEFDLRISSQDEKQGWGRSLTLLYENKYYLVWKQLEGEPPRPYVYLLKEVPPEERTLRMHRYDPNQPLAKK